MFPHGTPVPREWWEDALDRMADRLTDMDPLAACAAVGCTLVVVLLAMALTAPKH